MTKPNLTSSASLHLRLSAFGALFVALAANFEPLLAFVFALVAAGVLSKL
jgi:hypothetical protein